MAESGQSQIRSTAGTVPIPPNIKARSTDRQSAFSRSGGVVGRCPADRPGQFSRNMRQSVSRRGTVATTPNSGDCPQRVIYGCGQSIRNRGRISLSARCLALSRAKLSIVRPSPPRPIGRSRSDNQRLHSKSSASSTCETEATKKAAIPFDTEGMAVSVPRPRHPFGSQAALFAQGPWLCAPRSPEVRLFEDACCTLDIGGATGPLEAFREKVGGLPWRAFLEPQRTLRALRKAEARNQGCRSKKYSRGRCYPEFLFAVLRALCVLCGSKRPPRFKRTRGVP